MASEERRCFGERAAERSADAALVVPEEANPLTPNQHLNPLHCKQRGILNEGISAP